MNSLPLFSDRPFKKIFIAILSLVRFCIFLIFFIQIGFAQFGDVHVSIDDHLLRGNERQDVFPLYEDVKRFFQNTMWNDEYKDLNIPLHLQIIFEGTSTKGSVKTYLAQALFSNGKDQRYFASGVQFFYKSGSVIHYDPVIFEPLPSFLAYYGNLILAGEIDTYEPNGGTSTYEICRTIALRGSASDYPRGWSNRVTLVNDLSANLGLRKAKFSYYYAVDLFNNGNIESALTEFKLMIDGLEEVKQVTPREQNTLYFLKTHAKTLTGILSILQQEQLLRDLIYLDSDNEEFYQAGLDTISR